MTCRMAAGQQKRRLSNSNLHDPIKGKKKKRLDSSDYTLRLRPHIDLDWDDRRKRVIPKKEQVGLAWKDMGPFVEKVPQPCKGLADVIHVPKEIFGLRDLSDVLSYEVWASCLSESDRKLLSQFLPSGIGTGQAVRSLLKGENLHFGNQFTQWSTSVCAGDMHPDAVRWKEKQFLSDKKAYYVELNNYHSSMIENLERWKEKWKSCKDPEKLFRDTPAKHRTGSIASPPEKPKVNKREVLQKVVRPSYTSKYMSYVKISKSQYEQVKNIKHSGEGFLPKLLTPVLGDVKSLNVKPYDSFVEEEKTRLHGHWLHVVKEDLPVSFKAWNGRNTEIREWKTALISEIPAGFEAWRKRNIENEQLMKSSSVDVDDDDNMSDMEEDISSHELERSEQPMTVGEYENNSSPDVSEEHEESEGEEQEGELQQEEENELDQEEENELDQEEENELDQEEETELDQEEENELDQEEENELLQDEENELQQEEENELQQDEDNELQQEEEDDDDDEEEEEEEEEEGEDAEAELEPEVQAKQDEEVEAVEGNSTEEDMAEEEAEAEIEEPVPLIEEHHNLANITSYRHDLERIPSLNSHHKDPTTPSETEPLIAVSTSAELAEPFPCNEMGQPSDPEKWAVSAYSQQPEYMQPGESSLKLSELITQQRSGGVNAVIDLERNVMEMDNSASLFCSDMMPSFQKEPEMLVQPYSQGSLNGMKQQVAGMPSFLLASERPPGSIQAQRRLLEQRQQVRDTNLYMHQQQQALNRPPSLYPTSSYPNQGYLPSMGPTRQNMNVNVNVNMTNNLRFPLNNTGNSWLPQEHQIHANTSNSNSWSGMDTSIANSDGSLFSVLSECNKIPPRMQYQSMNTEQYATTRSFGLSGAADNVYGYMPSQLGSNNNNNNNNNNNINNVNNRSVNPSTAAGTMDTLAWMNYRQQNSNRGMPDSMGRTFSRPWDR